VLERHGIKNIQQYFIAFLSQLPCTQRSSGQIFTIIFNVILNFYYSEARPILQITPLLQIFKAKVTIGNCRFSEFIKFSTVYFFATSQFSKNII
tara:strand:- start:3259 stop:3540 length:282 start_codon:yes stop_codon:yes gene_type:complete